MVETSDRDLLKGAITGLDPDARHKTSRLLYVPDTADLKTSGLEAVDGQGQVFHRHVELGHLWPGLTIGMDNHLLEIECGVGEIGVHFFLLRLSNQCH